MNAVVAGIASCLHAVVVACTKHRMTERLCIGEAFVDADRQPAGADPFSVLR